jgi:multidrug transporter EmrE-like cation transporter
MSLVYLTVAFTLNAIANILLKVGAKGGVQYKDLNILEIITHNYLPILGLICFAANVVFYFLALRNVPLSTAYLTMVIMSFLIINSFSYFYLHENINGPQLLGYGFIIAGLVLVFYFTETIPS